MISMQLLGKWLWRCELVLFYAAVLSTIAMMLLTSADALGRYLLNSPIPGAYELTEKYLMVAAIFLGLSYAYRRGGVFIRVSFLVERLPAAVRLAADHVAYVVSIACCMLFLVATAQQSLRALADATTLSVLPVPLGPAYVLVPLGLLSLVVLMLADLPRVRKGDALMFMPEEPIT